MRRYEKISSVLIKYGFEALIKDLLPKTLLRDTKERTNQWNDDVNRRIKLAIQELGPTFVKFAQIMSTRREMLPPELINELKELTDKVEPVSFDRIKPTIEEQCGPIEATFSYLEEQPFAAASLSQAHIARLKDGTVLVLKIQRPGIKEVIETDLEILQSAAARLDGSKPELRVYNLPAMVHEFRHQILSELDFVRDGKNAELAAANIADIEGVRVPKIYWDYTGPKLLAMEYVKGVRLDKVEAIKSMDLDPREIALKAFRVLMKQMFQDGFYHGDPHPGNMLVTPDGELVILDFGLVGILRPEKRDQFLRLLLNIVDKDVNGLVESLRRLGVKIDAGQEQLKDELYIAMMRSSNSGKDSTIGSFEEVISILRTHHIKVPGDAMLMIKVVMMLDGEVRTLYPEFDFVKESQPIVTQMATDSIMDEANIRRTAFTLVNTLQSTSELPRNINDAFKAVSKGNFNINIANDDVDRLGRCIDHAAYKGLLGMILASIVIGMSLVVVAMREVLSPNYFGLAVAAYLIAIVAGLYSVYHLIRNK